MNRERRVSALIRSGVCLLGIVPLLTGCFATKCVKVVDAQGKAASGTTLSFSAYRTPNMRKYGGLLSHIDNFYDVDIEVADKNGEMCFSDYKVEDSNYVYKESRRWTFRLDERKATYSTFSSIPDTVVLQRTPPPSEEDKKRRELIEKELRIP